MNLAFDVTPAKYVTGLITEKGVCEASEKGLKGLFKWEKYYCDKKKYFIYYIKTLPIHINCYRGNVWLFIF